MSFEYFQLVNFTGKLLILVAEAHDLGQHELVFGLWLQTYADLAFDDQEF